jgi:hypothetical protein
MTRSDILTRLKIGLALVVGYVTGTAAARYFGHHGSEFFSGGFLFGVLATQGLCRAIGKYRTLSAPSQP